MPEIRPVKRAGAPKYPTKYEALRRPDILRNVPRRWQNKPAVMAALGMTLFLSSCGARNGMAPTASPGTSSPESGAPTPSPTEPATQVAPIFQHGGGLGTYGCVSVVAPYILTEDEALALIADEAQSYGGLALSADNLPAIGDLTVSWVDLYGDSGEAEKKAGDNVIELAFDAASPGGEIAVEFVSYEDMHSMAIPQEYLNMWASVESVNYLSQAESIRNAVAGAEPDYAVGVLYDPYSYTDIEAAVKEYEEGYGETGDDTDWGAYYEGMTGVIRTSCEENLRAQVRDFIDWLKGQGII